MAKWLLAAPPALFAGLALLFYAGMDGKSATDLPSAFIGKAAPVLPETGLPGIPQLTAEDLRKGEVTVLNFWASWCPPCRAEHPVLKEMDARGIRVAGINMMDAEADATAYLQRDGNPFFALATDPIGRNRVEWGVTNPPETFIIGGDGTVLFKFTGPLVGTDYETRFLPELEKALQ
ncbi:DsbE family thiol:disulfide interchange protein [Xinfangfangia sp. CPCC 101601]|uniref:DsbE family thiol:disulfide interchange protein n=1 Tax=Pseudogemmobacter lacusdianii TaxID=3069608 RepID=A0ABU0VXX1_9RHOB|nr:DsbE family thiol:disulfide interchange protein [Xinfangfangia sp. CPCC 101601]MDQ2066606.1 DsbE family thiol:disulfide interchange protein [Xinfangfangia sp. CPCC 101601]